MMIFKPFYIYFLFINIFYQIKTIILFFILCKKKMRADDFYGRMLSERQIDLYNQEINENSRRQTDSTDGNNQRATKVDRKKRSYFDLTFKKATASDIQSILPDIYNTIQITLNGTETKEDVYNIFMILPIFKHLKKINVYADEGDKRENIIKVAQLNNRVEQLQFYNGSSQSSFINEKIYEDIKKVIQKLKQNVIKNEGKADYRRFKYIDILIILSANITQIQTLWICGCQIKDDSIIPQILNSYYLELKNLDLSDNYIGLKFLQRLKPDILNNLVQIKLACMETINDGCIKYLSQNMKKCQSIDLSYTSFTHVGICYLTNLQNIKYLNLWKGYYHPTRYYEHFQFGKNKNKNKNKKPWRQILFTEKNIQDICNMKLIGLTINIQGYEVIEKGQKKIQTDISILVFSLKKEAEYIEIGGQLSQLAIKHIEFNFLQLKRLFLLYTKSRIPRIQVKQIVSFMVLFGNKQVNLSFMEDIPLQKLQSLSLVNQNIEDSFFYMIKLNPLVFQSVNLTKSNITTKGIQILCQLRNLIWLDLSQTNVSDKGIQMIFIDGSLILKTFKFRNCYIKNLSIKRKNQQFYSLVSSQNELDDGSVENIVQNLPNVVNLQLNTNKITNAGLKLILNKLIKLKCLDIRLNKNINFQQDTELKQLFEKKKEKINIIK